MARQITCECGQIVRGETEAEVVDLTLEHLRSDHPQLADRIRPDHARRDVALIEVVESHPLRPHTPGREPDQHSSPASFYELPQAARHARPEEFPGQEGDLPILSAGR